MNRLIQLLNEYEEVNQSWKIRQFTNKAKKLYRNGRSYDTAEVNIISKKFGFIKRLVDNDKINVDENREDFDSSNLYCNSDFYQLQKHFNYYECLLMLLSIQDNPIEFLISILK